MNRSIFNNKSRIRLFSREEEERNEEDDSNVEYNEGGITLRKLECSDCGYTLESSASPTHMTCPMCGGKRMHIKIFPHRYIYDSKGDIVYLDDNEDASKSYIELDNNLTDYEKNLKSMSGKVVSKDLFEKKFSDKSDYLIQNGFAEVEGDNVLLNEAAFASEKLFSNIEITITKTLRLEPNISNGIIPKEDIIEKLEDRGLLPHKGIILIKRAHGIIGPDDQDYYTNGLNPIDELCCNDHCDDDYDEDDNYYHGDDVYDHDDYSEDDSNDFDRFSDRGDILRRDGGLVRIIQRKRIFPDDTEMILRRVSRRFPE